MAAENEIRLRMSLSGAAQVLSQLNQVVKWTDAASAVMRTLGVGLSLGGLAAGLKSAIDFADSMGKLSQKTGVAVQTLSALSYAAKLADLSSEELAFGLKNLAADLVKSGKGSADMESELLKLADRFADMPDGPEKTALALDKFGRSGTAMIPLLNQGAGEIRRLMEEARQLGIVIDQDLARRAEAFNDNLHRLGAQAKGLGLSVGNELLPMLNDLAQALLNVGQAVRKVAGGGGGATPASGTLAAMWGDLQTGVLGLELAMRKLAGTLDDAALDRFWKRYREIWKLTSQEQADVLPDWIKRGESSRPQPAYTADAYKADMAARELELAEEKNKLAELDLQDDQKSVEWAQKKYEIIERMKDVLLEMRDLTTKAGAAGAVEDQPKKMAELQSKYIALVQESHNVDKVLNDEAKREEDERFQLIERRKLAEQAAQKQRVDWEMETSRQIRQIRLEEEREREDLRERALQGAHDMFGNMATAAKAFGRKGFTLWKAMAISQATVDMYKSAVGAYSAMVGIPYVGPIVAAIAAAAAIAAGAANIAQIAATPMPSYAVGGYTGDGSNKQVAGLAHKGEFVFSAPAVERIGVGNLQALHEGRAPTAAAAERRITLVQVRDWNEAQEYMRSREGTQEIVRIVGQHRHAFV